MVTAGQRRINLIWEMTQAFVAMSITAAVIYCEVHTIDAPTVKLMFVAIASTYFARTNHTKIGGVGPKQEGR
jgi:hypothetical protein